MAWLCAVIASAALLGNALAWSQEEPHRRSREATRSLNLPSRSSRSEHESPNGRTLSVSNGIWNTAISLSLIVGTLLVAGRWMKGKGFGGSQSLPIEAFEVLGRRVLEPKASIHLVKVGKRVLLLGVGTDGVRTLSEFDDPADVDHLVASCQSTPKSDTSSRDTISDPVPLPASVSSTLRRGLLVLMAIGLWWFSGQSAFAQTARPATRGVAAKDKPEATAANARQRAVQQAAFEQNAPHTIDPQQLVSPQQLGLSIKMLALMTVFSLAPSILMMTTSFVRFTVVLGLLRQALGTAQGPPNQVLTAISLFLTFLVMSPVWQRSYQEGIRPYTNPAAGEQSIDEVTALNRALAPIREFMSQQIDKAGNSDAVWMMLDYQNPVNNSDSNADRAEPQSYDDVPFTVLAPAYLLSELKVAFLIGFQLFLPFLVIDLVVATTLASLGLNILPPSMVSLPLKLLLFVLIDGWFLTVGMLLESVKLVS